MELKDVFEFIYKMTGIFAPVFIIWLQVTNSKKLDKNSDKVESIHHEMNSMKDQLVAVTRKDALQEGAAVERKEAADRKAEFPTKIQVEMKKDEPEENH